MKVPKRFFRVPFTSDEYPAHGFSNSDVERRIIPTEQVLVGHPEEVARIESSSRRVQEVAASGVASEPFTLTLREYRPTS